MLEGYTYEVSWRTTFAVLQCCGCCEISFKKSEWFSEASTTPDDTFDEYYPPRVSRRPPEWLRLLPPEYSPLLTEVYSSLNAGNYILAMMGTRAILDIFIVRKAGDCGTFKNALDKLESSNYLAKMNRPIIELAIEAGNAAAHRAYKPTLKILDEVINIVENIIQHDVLKNSAKTLRKNVPRRPRAKRKLGKTLQRTVKKTP